MLKVVPWESDPNCFFQLFPNDRMVRLTLLANELAIVAADLHCLQLK